MSTTQLVANRVREALAAGVHVIHETDTYRQHLLRENPHVCRQTNRYTSTYVLHDEPCGCAPDQAHRPSPIATATCCQMVQPIGVECIFCGEELS